MARTPRERMITSAAVLMRERGVDATSFSEVLAHSGAPRGSIYHHFPAGKSQLIEEATRYAGEYTAAGLAKALADGNPVEAIRGFSGMWLGILRESDFAAGCPVMAATLEGERLPGAREAAATAFASWEERIADALTPHLKEPHRARSLASTVVAALEGAVVLARAQRRTEPLEHVATELERLLAAALER
jgi:TetR/AcrR family transcriptional regulator, lmrAB and yxaGH operons repressor